MVLKGFLLMAILNNILNVVSFRFKRIQSFCENKKYQAPMVKCQIPKFATWLTSYGWVVI